LISNVGLVALVRNIAAKVEPRDGIRASYEDRVRYRAKGLANVGGVGNVSVRGEENGTNTRRVGGITD
jgi:hypothetical protein